MKINRNMSAVMTNRQLLRTENKLSASMERLSSGYKINRAGDNPAGMAISNKMRLQIDGLNRAENNSADGQSVLKIADGALNEVSNMLQRIRELSVQAANGTNSLSERESIQQEINQLTKEVDRISKDTEYNQKTLLDGSSNVRSYSKQVDRLDVSEHVLSGTYRMTVIQKAAVASASFDVSGASADGTISINGIGVEYQQGMDEETFYENLRQCAEEAGCKAEREGSGYKITAATKGAAESVKITMSEELAVSAGFGQLDDKTGVYTVSENGKDAKVELDRAGSEDTKAFSGTTTVSTAGDRITITDNGGFSIDFMLKDDIEDGDEVSIDVTEIGALSIQLGANQYQDMDVRIPEVSSKSLYLDTINVMAEGGTDKALVTMDKAIAKLSSIRSGIGAYTNRLEYAQASLAESQEDVTSAYSGLMDTDMAEEMTEYTQRNVLEQAAISVLSQANDLPQQVLSLLQ